MAQSLAGTGLPHGLLVDAAREAIAAGDPGSAAERAAAMERSLLRPVINATGVLLHTNLGRAPLGTAAAGGTGGPATPLRYSNLEFDTQRGVRGDRHAHAGGLLAKLCGAEAALVVNNCAAAVTLALGALAAGRGVAVSRGELVEIGGGFRVPEIVAQSGARLVEVGTTNRTRRQDYAVATEAGDVALCLRVHQSNYRIVGFTEAPAVGELADLGVPLVVDIGSGLVDEACQWLAGGPPAWLRGEPAARQTLAAGADLVTFSGDKLLGGPQAGIIAGSAELVQRCARHPLARAFRAGGLVLGTLQSLALTYLHRCGDDIPFWHMATRPVGELRARAEALGVGEVCDMAATTGGGTLPGVEIPSAGISLEGDMAAALRDGDVPVVARVAGQRTYLDLRTVDPADDAILATVARSACGT
ncbi:MAG: L-seryl-tRNA(Sec) selenium transferase [Acidimicrobiia bacterium]|nr:L-seryl-tRNA(Sec) selenium transferase [Acidimicrobiia bacterium]